MKYSQAANAQLPVIVQPPSVEFAVCVHRQPVVKSTGVSQGDLTPICGSTNSYRVSISPPPNVEFTVCVDRQAFAIYSPGDLDPICFSAYSYRAAFMSIRTIAQLPVIVTSPSVEFTVCVDRKAADR